MDEEGISMEKFKEAFEKGNRFASGIGKCISGARQKRILMQYTHSC